MTEGNALGQECPQEWFWAAATYKAIRLGTVRRRHLWQRIVFLVQATDTASARDLAHKTAVEKQHEYQNDAGSTVRWVFQSLEEVAPLFDEAPTTGTEVYWRLFERVDGAGLQSTLGKGSNIDQGRLPWIVGR